jgi:chromosome segregation ATPase
MQEIDQGLLAQKEEYSSKMESVEQRRADLSRKQKQLKESLEKFDKFLKENDAKKIRAIKKAVEERKIREQKEGEIQKLREILESLSVHKDRQGKIITKGIQGRKY